MNEEIGTVSRPRPNRVTARENTWFQAQGPSCPYTSRGVKILTVLGQACIKRKIEVQVLKKVRMPHGTWMERVALRAMERRRVSSACTCERPCLGLRLILILRGRKRGARHAAW